MDANASRSQQTARSDGKLVERPQAGGTTWPLSPFDHSYGVLCVSRGVGVLCFVEQGSQHREHAVIPNRDQELCRSVFQKLRTPPAGPRPVLFAS